MVSFRETVIAATLGCLCLCSSLQAKIEPSLSQSTCRPGDVIRLEALRTSEDFATFELHIPAEDRLHLVAHQPEPITYQQGEYQQKDVWIFQSIAPDTIELTSLRAMIHKDGESIEESLPPLTLKVESYEMDAAPSDSPQPLPPATASTSRAKGRLALLVSLALAILGGLIWWFARRRVDAQTESVSAVPSLDNILMQLESGEMPIREMEQALADPNAQLPPTIRTPMEQAVYGHGVSVIELRRCIEQEVRA